MNNLVLILKSNLDLINLNLENNTLPASSSIFALAWKRKAAIYPMHGWEVAMMKRERRSRPYIWVNFPRTGIWCSDCPFFDGRYKK